MSSFGMLTEKPASQRQQEADARGAADSKDIAAAASASAVPRGAAEDMTSGSGGDAGPAVQPGNPVVVEQKRKRTLSDTHAVTAQVSSSASTSTVLPKGVVVVEELVGSDVGNDTTAATGSSMIADDSGRRRPHTAGHYRTVQAGPAAGVLYRYWGEIRILVT